MRHPNDFRRMRRIALALASTYILLHPATVTAEQHLNCPPQVDAHQIAVSSPLGWKGLYRPKSRALLVDARVWIGPLDDVPGELVGETVKGKNGATIHRFPALDLLPLVDGVRVPQDKWIVCAYGDGGIVQAQKLREDTRQCDVIYRRMQDPLEPRRKMIDVLSDIICK